MEEQNFYQAELDFFTVELIIYVAAYIFFDDLLKIIEVVEYLLCIENTKHKQSVVQKPSCEHPRTTTNL